MKQDHKRRASRIRQLFLVGCLLFGLSVVVFPKFYLLSITRWGLSWRCGLACEAVTWGDEGIIFHQGVLKRGERLEVSFACARLVPHFDWKALCFDGELVIEELSVVQRKLGQRPIPDPPKISLPLAKLNLKTTIEGAKLTLYDHKQTAPQCQQLRFDLNHTISQGQTHGSISFDWEKESPPLTVFFSHADDKVVRLSTAFQTHPLQNLYGLLAYYFDAELPQTITHWNFVEGLVDGKLFISIREGAPELVKGELRLAEVQGENRALELLGAVDVIDAHLDLNFTALDQMNGEFALHGGRLALGESADFWRGIWDLSHLETTIKIREGVVETSTLHGRLLGMEGELILDWYSPDLMMQMGFSGHSSGMAALLPEAIAPYFGIAFPDDHFSVEAQARRLGEGLEVEGAVWIKDGQSKLYQLDFGCILGHGVEGEVPIATSLSDQFLDHFKEQFCLSKKRLGWFRAEAVPVEKFLSPFLLSKRNVQLSGEASFEGTFDERYLVVFYEGEDFLFEGSHFSLGAKRVVEDKASEIVAAHYVDLETWDHVGFLPIEDVLYHERAVDLSFPAEHALIRFENAKIHIQDITTRWKDIEMQGEVLVDMEPPDGTDLIVEASYVAGSMETTRLFLKRFIETSFWDVPITGEISGDGEVLYLHYFFTPKAELQEVRVNGRVNCSHSNALFQVADYQVDFGYDYTANALTLKGGHGELTIPLIHKSYQLSTPDVKLNAFPDFHFQFTAEATDEQGTIYPMTGQTRDVGEVREFAIDGTKGGLEATRSSEGWEIKKLALGPWLAGAMVAQSDDCYTIESFQLIDERGAELIFSGEYDRKAGRLWGTLDKVRWLFEEGTSPWHPQGELLGRGYLQWNMGGELTGELTSSFKDLHVGGLHFGSGEDLKCRFSSRSGLFVEGLEVETPAQENYKLGCFHYDFPSQKISFDGFDFSLPPEQLPWVAEMADTLFPGKINATLLSLITNLKQDEPFKGRLSLDLLPESVWVYLSLEDGIYHFEERDLLLENFTLIYDPIELRASTQCHYRNEMPWLHFAADSMTFTHGHLSISEEKEDVERLVVEWERRPEKGWAIQSVAGDYHGIRSALHAVDRSDFSDKIALDGRIEVDPELAASLLSPSVQRVLARLALGGGYAFDGSFVFDKKRFSKMSAEGILSGSDFRLGKIDLAEMRAYFTYADQITVISDLLISDWAGSLEIGQLLLYPHAGEWLMAIDSLAIRNLRLSRLCSPWTNWRASDRHPLRSMFISQFVLDNFSGKLTDLKTLVGNGELSFTNLPKRTLLSNLLILPSEITARIGLDFTNFIPVRGTVTYSIDDGRVHLNEFQDVYSSGKHSRFFLVDATPAFIDFEGNLSMQIGMKQYTLLMKLADLFTVTVEGSIFNPTYTLTNAPDSAG